MTTTDVRRPTFLGAWTPGSQEWHQQRAGKVGGSDIAAILGLSPWDSLFSLWHRRKGLVAPQVEKPEMSWGKRLEPIIVEAFAENHPDFMVSYEPGSVWAHPERPWQVCSPDALIATNPTTFPPNLLAGLEVKTDRFFDGFGDEGTDEIPVHYMPQIQWCLDVFGLDTWHVAFLCSGSDYREYIVHANPDDQAFMRERAQEFLRTLETDERPDIDSHSVTYQVVREMHPAISSDEVELSAEVAHDYCMSRLNLSAAEAEATRMKSVISDLLGDAKRATFLGQTIAQRQAKGLEGVPYLVAGRNLPTFGET